MVEDVISNVVDDDLIDSVADWLMDRALGDASVENLMEGCCNRLRATGIPCGGLRSGSAPCIPFSHP